MTVTINSILPKKRELVPSKLMEIVRQEEETAAKRAKREYETTVRTWQAKPTFFIQPSLDGLLVSWRLDEAGKHYTYVDFGTGIYGPRKTPIRPKNGPYLVFRPIERTKSIPNKITARAGKVSDQLVFAKEVKGTEARNFSKLIAERSRKSFQVAVSRRIKAELK